MRRRIELVLVLFFISGFSGLIYESVWSHYVKLFLGHAAYAQTLVLVVFIGGLALGSWLCARVSERIRNPLRIYAWVELAIGAMAMVFHSAFNVAVEWGYSWLLPAACEQASTFCGPQWLLSALMLAPQSILLGATFPLVSSAVLRMSGERPGYEIATLYFLNSLGAVLGVLASAFLLIPAWGLPGTLFAAGVGNLVIASVAYVVSRTAPPALAIAAVPATNDQPIDDRRLVQLLLLTSALTGLSSFIYEIAWIRMLSLVLGASTYSFELMLGSFILGLALGGLWVRNRVDVGADAVRVLGTVQIVMGVLAVATIPLYNVTFDFMAWLLSSVSRTQGGFAIFNIASTAISLVVMLPATFCAGMTLPLITYRLLRSRSGERALGAVYAVNTLGSILGVVIAVHLLLVWVGVARALIVGAAIDVLLGIGLLAWHAGGVNRMPRGAIAGLLAFVVMISVSSMDPARMASGVFRTGAARIADVRAILYHRDGKTATVDVTGDATAKSIRTNGKPDAAMTLVGEYPIPDEYTMALLALLPLGHHPQAKNAAVIGFGSGMSTSVLLASPTLQRVDTIEIEPAMIEGASLFRPVVDRAFTDPRSHIVVDDAKSYFARGRNRYDIVVSEPSNPWVSGVASLFTQEFYARLATYINDGGVLAQWLHAYEIDAPTIGSLLAALEKTFPDYVVYTPNDADIVIIARKNGSPGRFDPAVLRYPAIQPMLAKLKMTDPEVVQRRVVASSDTLRPYFAAYGQPPNSDFHPVVDRRASKTRFTQARVSDLDNLQNSGFPILEMLDGRFGPSSKPHDAHIAVGAELGAATAWSAYEAFGGRRDERFKSAMDDVARYVRVWTKGCSDAWTFADMLPAFIQLAEPVNTQLPPEVSTQVWSTLGQAKCAMSKEDRTWLELLDSVARRDARRMATIGSELLERSSERGQPQEYAFFAAAIGHVCTGNISAADELLRRMAKSWVRPNHRPAEIHMLTSIVNDARAAKAAARCVR